jgi:hypothetical protein
LVKKKRFFLFLIDELLMIFERNDRDLIRRENFKLKTNNRQLAVNGCRVFKRETAPSLTVVIAL